MRGIFAALFVGVAVFLVVGCGGSSNDAATTEAADTAIVADTTTDTSTEATTDEMTDTETTSDDTSTTASGLSEGCQAVADFSTEFSKALAAAGGGSGSSADDLEASAKAYETAADKAPEEVRDAFKTLATAYAAYAKALEGVDLSSGATPSPATIAKIVAASKVLSGTDLASASSDITGWVTENCTGG